MKYFQFRKGAKDDKSSFKSKDEETNKLSWTLKGVYYNAPKDVVTKEWKNVTIPANVNVVLENDISISFSIEWWNLFRAVVNSLLTANVWDSIEFYTYTNKEWYKSVSLTNPTIKKEITTKEWKVVTVNQSYAWWVEYQDIPEVEVIKNKKGEYVSSDDTEANEFFITKLKDKFGKQEEKDGTIDIGNIPF